MGASRRGRRSADTVAEVVAVTIGARIESDLLVQRIEVAILNSAAKQCCVVESAKYFYNSIGTTRTSHDVRFSAASEGKADFKRVRLRSLGLCVTA